MMTVAVSILSQPSKSKGWARYQLRSADGTPVVESRTGNIWVSANHDGETTDGTLLMLGLDVSLQSGKGGRRREERSQQEIELIAAAGETCEIEYRPGSQGIRLRIDGARRVEV